MLTGVRGAPPGQDHGHDPVRIPMAPMPAFALCSQGEGISRGWFFVWRGSSFAAPPPRESKVLRRAAPSAPPLLGAGEKGGHARAMDGLTAVAHDLFLLALAIWVGGVAVLLVVLRGGRTRPEDVAFLEAARQRAGTTMRWSVIALIATLAAEVALHALATAHGDARAAFSGP